MQRELPMMNYDLILKEIDKIELYPQSIIDAIRECEPSDEVLEILDGTDEESIDLQNVLVAAGANIILAVNLAQTIQGTTDEFKVLIDRMTLRARPKYEESFLPAEEVQNSLFNAMRTFAADEYIAKGILKGRLNQRLDYIAEAIK